MPRPYTRMWGPLLTYLLTYLQQSSRLLCARTAPLRLDWPRETWPVAPLTPAGNVLCSSRGPGLRAWRPGGSSDATVTRESPTTADVNYLKAHSTEWRRPPCRDTKPACGPTLLPITDHSGAGSFIEEGCSPDIGLRSHNAPPKTRRTHATKLDTTVQIRNV